MSLGHQCYREEASQRWKSKAVLNTKKRFAVAVVNKTIFTEFISKLTQKVNSFKLQIVFFFLPKNT